VIGNQYFESGIARTIEGGDVILEHETDVVSTYSFDIFPNIVKTDCRISFNIQQSGNIKLKLFDATGRLVKIVYNQYLEKGTHEMDVDFSGLRNGIYIVFLESASETYRAKFVKIK
jgi:hypothetical protein